MENYRREFGFKRNVFVAGFVSFFMDISSEMIYPIIPLFLANVLGVNKSVIGLIEGIAESTASLLRVFSGWLSDRIGNRKWLMVIGYSISTFSRPIIALASSWKHVMVSRFIDRVGKGVRTAPRDAIIVESTQKKFFGRAFGFHRSMDTMGAVIGPVITFFLLGLLSNNYRIIFWLSMIPGAIAVLLIIFFIKEERAKREEVSNKEPLSKKSKVTTKHPFLKKGERGLLDWKFKIFVLIVTLFAIGNSSDVFLILRAQQIGIPAILIPVVYFLFNLIYSLSSFPAGIVADRFGKKIVILIGFLLFAILYYGFAIVRDTMTIWVLFACYGIFMGLTEGIQKAFLATIIPSNFKATAFGIFNTVVGLAMFPASLIGGWLWDNISPSATFYFGSITATLSALLFVIFISKIKS